MLATLFKEEETELNFNALHKELSGNLIALGSGRYGHAFEYGDKQAIKLHPYLDMGYICFIRYVKSLQKDYSNEDWIKHFPIIYEYREYKDCVVVVMERLYHCSTFEQMDETVISSITNKSVDDVCEAMNEAKNRFLYKLSRVYYIYMSYAKYRDNQVIDSLENAMSVLLLEVYKEEFACDLHSGNLLFRKNAERIEAVIIDPFVR